MIKPPFPVFTHMKSHRKILWRIPFNPHFQPHFQTLPSASQPRGLPIAPAPVAAPNRWWVRHPHGPWAANGSADGGVALDSRLLGSLKLWCRRVRSLVIHIYIGVNYGKLKYFTNLNCWAIWGWFPLLTMISVRSQWGRYNLPIYYI